MASVDELAARALRDDAILALAAKGVSERAIAAAMNVSRTTVWTVKQRAQKPRGGAVQAEQLRARPRGSSRA